MDIIDQATYSFEWKEDKNLAEETRKAFVNLFNSNSNDALLVARFLIKTCKWEDMCEYNDPIVEAKINSLRNVILSIKNQLNMDKIEEVTYE